LELLELLAEEREVDDGPRTEYAERVRIEDAARHEVELEGAVLVDDGVSGVVAALEPDDQVRLLRQEVRDLAFAFVAPLSPDAGRVLLGRRGRAFHRDRVRRHAGRDRGALHELG